MQIVENKKWYQSKTLWVNTLMFISGIALMVVDNLETGVPLTITSVLNMILRIVTKTKLE